MNLAAPIERPVARLASSPSRTVAVIFSRLGPYHCARLAAANRETPIVALEVAGNTSLYAWDKVASGTDFSRRTLFPDAVGESVGWRELEERLRAELESLRPDAVAIPGWSDRAALLALRWCAEKGAPTILMSESTAWDESRRPWKEWVKKRIIGLCSTACVGGRAHADYLCQLGMPRHRMFTGCDSVDNQYFAAGAAKARREGAEARIRHGLPENYFLASARFIGKKNLTGLIEAYAQYRRTASRNGDSKSENFPRPWDLVLLGDGELKPNLRQQVVRLSLEDSVWMPGFKQYHELPAYYGLAGAFVHASVVEQWGLVVNEAMACELPVLVSNRCGCATDLVRASANGFTFDPRNVGELADLMGKMAFYPGAVREKMGRMSGKIISKRGQERFARSLVKAKEKAIEIGARRASLLDALLLRALCRR